MTDYVSERRTEVRMIPGSYVKWRVTETREHFQKMPGWYSGDTLTVSGSLKQAGSDSSEGFTKRKRACTCDHR